VNAGFLVNSWDSAPFTGSIPANDFPGLIQPFMIYNFGPGGDVIVDFELTNSFQSQALTFNQASVAEDMDDVVGDPRAFALIGFLGNEPLANLPHDFDLIAPEEFAALYELPISNAVIRNTNLQQRMDDIRAGSTGFCAAGFAPQISGKETYSKDSSGKATLEKNPAPAFVPTPENRWGIWVTGRGEYVDVGNDDDNATGYSLDNGGVTFGADYRWTPHFATGVYGGYDFGRANLFGQGSSHINGANVGGFATFWTHGFYIDAAGGGGWNNYDNRRAGLPGNIVVATNPVTGLVDPNILSPYAFSNADGQEWNAMVDVGYDFHWNCFLVGPFVSYQYTDVHLDSFTETGTLAPLEIQDQDQDSSRLAVGVRAAYDWHVGSKGVIFRPEVRAAWHHEFSDTAYEVDSRLASGAGDVFPVFGPTVGRDSGQVRAGLAVILSPNWALSAYYDGLIGRDNYDSNGGSGSITFSF
jgi:hypothetical protein